MLLDACPALNTQASGLKPGLDILTSPARELLGAGPISPWGDAPGTRISRRAGSEADNQRDATTRPAHASAGGEPAADRRRGGRRRSSPRTRASSSATARRRRVVLGFAIAFTVVLNISLLQRRFGPLERLVDEMERADLTRPGANLRQVSDPGGPEEVARLHQAFTRMLERLEAERRRASSAALEAQEEERARIARDLHDEVNQSLTGLAAAARGRAREGAARARRRARRDPRARQPRDAGAADARPPAAPDRARRPRAQGRARRPRARARRTRGSSRRASRPTGELGHLPGDAQLVVYRVAQEALSNAVRHSGAEHVRVALHRDGDSLELRVADDGARLHVRRGRRRPRDRRDARAGDARRRRLPDRIAARRSAQGFG